MKKKPIINYITIVSEMLFPSFEKVIHIPVKAYHKGLIVKIYDYEENLISSVDIDTPKTFITELKEIYEI